MVELIVLLCSIAFLIFIIHKNKETFVNNNNYYLSACPSGYKSFYTSNGDIVCCDGEVIVNKCIGDFQCTLNSKGTPDMPNCVQYILADYEEKRKISCPVYFSYFEDKENDMKGCTNGLLNDTLTGPRSTSQPTCKIYPTEELNKTSVDSCYNKKMLDRVACFGENCTKTIKQYGANTPILIEITFTNGITPRTCYTRKSVKNYFDMVRPKWEGKRNFLSRNILISEVAKAYYIDKTIGDNDVDFK
jgi:hypothetical protein